MMDSVTRSLRALPRWRLLSAIAVLLLPAVVWAATRMGGGERKEERALAARAAAHPNDPLAAAPAPVAELMRERRNWQASRTMRPLLRRDSPPEVVLVAARAEAGWGGWSNVRDLLEGKDWLDRVGNGEGWNLLARAYEEEERWKDAAAAYARFLRASGGPEAPMDTTRAVAELRQGLALLRAGETRQGVAALERARPYAGAIRPWIGLLGAEALAPSGDTARVRVLVERDGEGASPLRAQRARVTSYRRADDPAGARALALAFRARAGSDEARAALGLDAARAGIALGQDVRPELRTVMSTAPASDAAGEAARLLAEMPGISAGDRLEIARVRDRRGDNAAAAAGYRAWLASGAGTPAERRQVRKAMGTALFDAGQYAAAEEALRPLSDDPGAVYVMGRAQYRRGAGAAARATLLGLAERFPGTPQAADALFLLGDLAHDAGENATAAALYRRTVDAAPSSYRAGLARMRLGGMAFLGRDWSGAARRWEDQRALGPDDPLWTQATYWAGRAYLAAGDTARARARFREVRARQPVSYYAVLAARRLGEPYWPLSLPPGPPADPAARARVEGWLRGADLLKAAGLQSDAGAEVQRVVDQAGNDPNVLYALAEALNARDFTVHGTRLGLRLQRERGAYDLRLLRIIYPYPYRAIIEAEARGKKLDPFLVAGLTRQESTFSAEIVSPVGARGLMQVMPETGRGLAMGAGIRDWSSDLLFNPEINVHLGVRYLASQMREYDGRLPYVFSAYNAGPARVERWKRFPEAGRDSELFTERIPFDETRDYVKSLTRNISLYRGLYGEP
jgi:soluble lytic murein transglycosylase